VGVLLLGSRMGCDAGNWVLMEGGLALLEMEALLLNQRASRGGLDEDAVVPASLASRNPSHPLNILPWPKVSS
jgi:hypothetical protein